MMATKEQERKALAQIKKIVEGLGDDSYVATAFEGCFEMAENNINDDFGCSWKQTAEKALEDVKYYKMIADDECDKNAELQKQLEEMNEKVIDKNDLILTRTIILNQHQEAIEGLHESESKIVEFCEDPDSDNFHKAVTARKNYKKMDEEYRDLEARLHKISEAY